MSQGPTIVTGKPGQMREVKDQPDAYGCSDKWDFLNAMRELPIEHRRDCSCKGERHEYFCGDPEGERPVSVSECRRIAERFSPIWQDVLTVLEKDPDAFIVIR